MFSYHYNNYNSFPGCFLGSEDNDKPGCEFEVGPSAVGPASNVPGLYINPSAAAAIHSLCSPKCARLGEQYSCLYFPVFLRICHIPLIFRHFSDARISYLRQLPVASDLSWSLFTYKLEASRSFT